MFAMTALEEAYEPHTWAAYDQKDVKDSLTSDFLGPTSLELLNSTSERAQQLGQDYARRVILFDYELASAGLDITSGGTAAHLDKIWIAPNGTRHRAGLLVLTVHGAGRPFTIPGTSIKDRPSALYLVENRF